MFVGYFSFFDLGLGRALTQSVSKFLGKGRHEDIPEVAWSALLIISGLGLLASLLICLFSNWLLITLLKIPQTLQLEALRAAYVLAASIPFVITTAGLRGMLEAQQRFDLINAVGVPMRIFTYLGPMAVIPFSTDLFHITSILVLGRCITCVIHFFFVMRIYKNFIVGFGIHQKYIKPLFTLGGWMTLGNIIGPLMLYLDRFLIGGIISITAVAYYTTPYEIVTKLFIISGALSGVMFPAFSTSFVQNPTHTLHLYNDGIKWMFIILFPITLLISIFAKEGLALWLGAEFAENSFRVVQLLAIGVMMLVLESIPFALIQALGRPDIPAKLNLIELPCYLGVFWYLTNAYGIKGSAFAWMLRALIDSLILMIFAIRLLPKQTYNLSRITSVALLVAASFAFSMLELSIAVRIIFFSVSLLAYICLFFLLIDPSERALFRSKFGF
jgi:O-antigen/teichoic acid export membrane protein